MRLRASRFRTAALLVAALSAAGCATGAGGTGPGGAGQATAGLIGAKPAPKSTAAPKTAASSAAQKAAGADAVLQKAVTLIASATPASLAAAKWVAVDAGNAGAADARAAGAAADALLRGLYPQADGSAAAGAGTRLSGAPPTDPFLERIVPALDLLDPGAAVDDQKALGLKKKLAEAAALKADSPLPPYLAGVLLQRTSAPTSERRSQFEEALKRLPSFVPAAVQLMDTIVSSGAAAKELPLLQRLAMILPSSAERYEALARVDLAAGQPGMAADAAARGLLEAPEGAPGDAPRVRFAVLRAAALEASGDWYQAMSVLDALLRLDPGLTEAALAKARILHEKAQNDADALALLAASAAADPKSAAVPELKARILLDAGRSQEAEVELRHAHDLDPESVGVLTLLASVSAKAGQWADAASWLAQIPRSALGPEQVRLAWRVDTAQEEHEKALGDARLLFQATGSVDALALEARSMIAAGRPADALVVIDHALLAQEPSAALASELHTLRARAGSDDPLRDLRSALRENPDNVEALEAISDVLAAQKDYRKAAEYARRASVLDPSNAGLGQKAAGLLKQAAAQAPAPQAPPSE
jgi:tetratricopeptide (TPR) repeat protein